MNLGWQEMMLIMIFALVVFGPKRLPEIGRQVGRAVREVKKVSSQFEREVRSVSSDWERELKSVSEPFNQELKAGLALDGDHSSYIPKTTGEAASPEADGSKPAPAEPAGSASEPAAPPTDPTPQADAPAEPRRADAPEEPAAEGEHDR